MKKLLLCLALPACLFLGSCSKDSPTPAKPSMVGLWIGTISAANEGVQGLYESFDLKADSTMQVQGEGADGTTYYAGGTWSMAGTTFTAIYTANNFGNQGVVQTATGTWNAGTGQISGTWVNAGNVNNGSLLLTKVP